MNTTSGYGGHSARVKITLLLNGAEMNVVQLGPDFLFLDAPQNHPPANASLVLQVDESRRQWEVHLPDGISAESRRVAIANPE